jgi:hypothetical protein
MAYTAFIDGVRIDWFRAGSLLRLNARARSAALRALGLILSYAVCVSLSFS